jgi:uncharacterized protein YhbP (UPF0306 family)
MDELTQFLRKQTVIQIAPHGGEPWIANVLMACESPEKLIFVGSQKTKYGQMLLANSALAFATAWHASDNHLDRKGVQGVGTATVATDRSDIEQGVRLHNEAYPEFSKRITADWIETNDVESRVWLITPRYIKFWNDELYGENGTKEFSF